LVLTELQLERALLAHLSVRAAEWNKLKASRERKRYIHLLKRSFWRLPDSLDKLTYYPGME
jgi:hypothetical protein